MCSPDTECDRARPAGCLRDTMRAIGSGGISAGANALQPLFLAPARLRGRSERIDRQLMTFLIIIACVAAGVIVSHVHPEYRKW